MFEPAIVMLGIGLGSAILLAVAAKVFYVEVDPRIAEVEDALPGANCGGCGYSGCSACAEAIVEGKTPVDACIVGGPEVAAKVAKIVVSKVAEIEKVLPGEDCEGCGYEGCAACAKAMAEGEAPVDACVIGGSEVAEEVAKIMDSEVVFAEPKAALHYCTGGHRAARKYHYEGTPDCRAMADLYGGDLICKDGCFGFGNCVKACAFDALKMGEEGFPIVDVEKCVGCGACERACPTGVIAVHTLTERLLHFSNDCECVSPCQQLCPAQIDIPGYVDLAAKGKYAEAVKLIKERNPLPLICGRVCPAPCEAGCRRSAIGDEPVRHNYIKRFVADWEMNLPKPAKPTLLPKTGKKIAIIGGGPCGLSAAYYLRILGHLPTIYDSKPELGGMLRYGIPEYRLPKKVLDFEINEILDLGVNTEVNAELGKNLDIAKLEKEYDAILMAMGAWDNSSLRCEGEDLEGVWKGTEFLQKRELGINVDLDGKNVVVVGGGNTAMDACRSAIRQGAKQLTLLYRRTRKEMPANAVEIDAGEHEGVLYHFLAAPTRLIGDENGKLKQLEYIRMELGEPDASGRRRPVPIEGSETLMDVDVVIAAIGQRPLGNWYTDDLKNRGLRLTRWGTIEANEETLQSDIPHIFTGGDLWSGPALLIDAVGTGRRAARSIHYFLSGKELSFPKGTFKGPKRLDYCHKVPVDGVKQASKVPQPELPAKERIENFDEVDLTLSTELMKEEAARCLRCGTFCYFPDAQREKHEKGRSLREKIGDLLSTSPE